MMKRKDPKLELETKRKLFFQLGLFIVASATLMAFTYKSPIYLKSEKRNVGEIEELPIMIVENKTPIEIPKVEKQPMKKEASSPIFSLDLLNKIKTAKNKNKNEQIIVTTKKKIKTTFIVDTFGIGNPPPKAPIVEYPDFDAKFRGNWLSYLRKNMRYPEESIRHNEFGTAYVGFVVEKDGTITDVDVKNKSLSENLQKEAIRVVKASPRWKPGIENGEFVRSTKIVKINFILN